MGRRMPFDSRAKALPAESSEKGFRDENIKSIYNVSPA